MTAVEHQIARGSADVPLQHVHVVLVLRAVEGATATFVGNEVVVGMEAADA